MLIAQARLQWKRAWQSPAMVGILGTGIRAGVNLLLLPLVVLKLSTSEYTVWSVFVILSNFANLADLGFGSTIPRIYNYLLAGAEDFDAEGVREAKSGRQPNYDGISCVNITVRNLYLKISLGAIVLLAVGGTVFLLRPVSRSGLPPTVWIWWALLIVAVGYNLATYHWVLAVQGLNRMRDLQIVYVLGGLSYFFSVGILLCCKLGLISMVIGTFVKGFVMHGRCHQIYRQIVPKPAKPSHSDPEIIKKLWPNAWKFCVLSLGAFGVNSGSYLVCCQLLDERVIGSYFLTQQIGTFMMSFSSIWISVKWPEIAMLRAQGRLQEMAKLFARRLGVVMLSFLGMAVVALLAGNFFLELKGTHTRLLATPYLVFYFIYLTQQLFYVQFGSLAYTENVVPFFAVSLMTGLSIVVVSAILTWQFGLWGVLVAPLLVEMSCSSWYTVRRGFRGQPLSVKGFIRALTFSNS